MRSCTLTLFILLLFILYTAHDKASTSQERSACKSMVLVVLLVALYVMYNDSEGFRFQVTPWKKTCMSSNPSCNCCKKGFYGQNTRFEYTGDAERMDMSLTCAQNQPNPGPKNNPDDYDTLKDTYAQVEGYARGCNNSGQSDRTDYSYKYAKEDQLQDDMTMFHTNRKGACSSCNSCGV